MFIPEDFRFDLHAVMDETAFRVFIRFLLRGDPFSVARLWGGDGFEYERCPGAGGCVGIGFVLIVALQGGVRLIGVPCVDGGVHGGEGVVGAAACRPLHGAAVYFYRGITAAGVVANRVEGRTARDAPVAGGLLSVAACSDGTS